MPEILKAPFPYFGGKSSVADVVWQRFGNVQNYVEPFFGSGAMLLARPAPFDGVETVNDMSAHLVNVWRAIQSDPESVAEMCVGPTAEVDLEARHHTLCQAEPRLRDLLGDPDAYDIRLAAWWVKGCCEWIGSGWCSGGGPWQWDRDSGWFRGERGKGLNRKRPHLGNAGLGVNRQLPHFSQASAGEYAARVSWLTEWFSALRDRLCRVRICCGDWSRVVTSATLLRFGVAGVFLDPPYADTAGRTDSLYEQESLTVAHDVREWAVENGRNPQCRIALCGYEGEHQMPDDWECVAWSAHGGYSNQSDDAPGKINRHRERIWFSPGCLKTSQQRGLFGAE